MSVRARARILVQTQTRARTTRDARVSPARPPRARKPPSSRRAARLRRRRRRVDALRRHLVAQQAAVQPARRLGPRVGGVLGRQRQGGRELAKVGVDFWRQRALADREGVAERENEDR
jgi:hypothetical protein